MCEMIPPQFLEGAHDESESAAPAWHELRPVYRRLEARGEIRGGRFVANVAGEQFALSDAIDKLRRTRDEPPKTDWHLISAADPLNLIGILTKGPRVPATRGNRVLFLNGRPIAARESKEVRWLQETNESEQRPAVILIESPEVLRHEPISHAEGALPL